MRLTAQTVLPVPPRALASQASRCPEQPKASKRVEDVGEPETGVRVSMCVTTWTSARWEAPITKLWY